MAWKNWTPFSQITKRCYLHCRVLNGCQISNFTIWPRTNSFVRTVQKIQNALRYTINIRTILYNITLCNFGKPSIQLIFRKTTRFFIIISIKSRTLMWSYCFSGWKLDSKVSQATQPYIGIQLCSSRGGYCIGTLLNVMDLYDDLMEVSTRNHDGIKICTRIVYLHRFNHVLNSVHQGYISLSSSVFQTI